MAGIRQLQERQERWRSEKPEGGAGGFNLYPKGGDIVRAHLLSSGEDNDPWFEVYYAHEIPARTQGGYASYVYCPVESHVEGEDDGHDPDYPCPYCELDGYKLKKRMIMGWYVWDILHEKLAEGQKWPTVTHMGRNYYQQEVNAGRIWETSAWKDSCLDDLIFLGAQMGDMRTLLMNLLATGEGLSRRYKVHSVPNTDPLDQESYDEAVGQLKTCLDILYDQLKPVQQEVAEEVVEETAEVEEVAAPAQPGRRAAPASAPVTARPAARSAGPRAATPPQAFAPTSRAAPASKAAPAAAPAAAGTPGRRRGLF